MLGTAGRPRLWRDRDSRANAHPEARYLASPRVRSPRSACLTRALGVRDLSTVRGSGAATLVIVGSSPATAILTCSNSSAPLSSSARLQAEAVTLAQSPGAPPRPARYIRPARLARRRFLTSCPGWRPPSERRPPARPSGLRSGRARAIRLCSFPTRQALPTQAR